MKCLTQNKFLSDKELDQLRMNLKNERNKVHVLMVELALFTGARSAEILEVKTEDFNGKTVVIYGKKNSNNRTIPLSPAFAEKLSKYVKGLEEGSLLFPVSTRQFRKVWKKLTPNNNKSLHCLRHTNGVKLYNNCESLHTVKTMLGHVAISSSMLYLDFIEGDRKLKKAISGMWCNKLDVK